MNWFERYGIPGAYFNSLVIGWTYAFYPCLFEETVLWEPDWMLAVAAIATFTFLPAGYVISILGQIIYLNWRHRLAWLRRVRRCLGFHGAALDRLGSGDRRRDEAVIEADTLLRTVGENAPFDIDTLTYLRNWIARRMDVVAIDLSLFLATLVALIFAVILWGIREGNQEPLSVTAVIVLGIVSAAAVLVTLSSICTLRRQVIQVLAGIYRTYRVTSLRAQWRIFP